MIACVITGEAVFTRQIRGEEDPIAYTSADGEISGGPVTAVWNLTRATARLVLRLQGQLN